MKPKSGSKSSIVRMLLRNGLSTTEIKERTGYSTAFISTARWKMNHYERWLETHRAQVKRSYHKAKQQQASQ